MAVDIEVPRGHGINVEGSEVLLLLFFFWLLLLPLSGSDGDAADVAKMPDEFKRTRQKRNSML